MSRSLQRNYPALKVYCNVIRLKATIQNHVFYFPLQTIWCPKNKLKSQRKLKENLCEILKTNVSHLSSRHEGFADKLDNKTDYPFFYINVLNIMKIKIVHTFSSGIMFDHRHTVMNSFHIWMNLNVEHFKL